MGREARIKLCDRGYYGSTMLSMMKRDWKQAAPK